MANQKPTKLTNFFEGRRRKAFLTRWEHLKNRAGEPRIKLDLRLPLLNESVIGMNTEISEAYMVMAKENSKIEWTNLNVKLEGMTLDAFTTSDPATSKQKNISSTGTSMMKLALVSSGEAEKHAIDLSMVAYVPASIQLRDWAWEHLHQKFGIEAVYSQSEMDFDEEQEEEDAEADDEAAGEEESEDEEEQDPDSAPAIAARASKPFDPKAIHNAVN